MRAPKLHKHMQGRSTIGFSELFFKKVARWMVIWPRLRQSVRKASHVSSVTNCKVIERRRRLSASRSDGINRAANRLLPPPLRGRAGRGVVRWQRECVNLATPNPNPSPQGEGSAPSTLHCFASSRTGRALV